MQPQQDPIPVFSAFPPTTHPTLEEYIRSISEAGPLGKHLPPSFTTTHKTLFTLHTYVRYVKEASTMASRMTATSIAFIIAASLVNAQTTTTTTAAPSTPTSLSTSWVYAGCYSDPLPSSGSNSTTHALSTGYMESTNMTQTMCVSYCQTGGWGYAGIEYSTQCTCGNDLRTTSVLTSGETDCQYTCGGNVTTACGGFYYMSLFRNSALIAAASGSSSSATPSMVTSIRASSTSAASASTSASAASASASGTAAAAAAGSKGNSVSGGTIAGAVVGVIAGLAIIIGIFFFWKKKKAREGSDGAYGVSHSRGPSDGDTGFHAESNGQDLGGGLAGVGAGAGWVRNQGEDKSGYSKEPYVGRADEKMIQMENLPPVIPPRPLPVPPSMSMTNETNGGNLFAGYPSAPPSAYQSFESSMGNSPPSSDSSHQQGLYQHQKQPYGYQQVDPNHGQGNPFKTPQGSPVADTTPTMSVADSSTAITAGPVQRSVSISKRKPVPTLSPDEIAAGAMVRNSAYDGIEDVYDGIAYDAPPGLSLGRPVGASSTEVGPGWGSKPMKPMDVERPLGWQG
ncbi:beta-1,6-N-acetylglucosaminyltransferase, contains WSC domain [Phaffia rhodozyma]|uniref:Beta-1,6-N-acetylglucosaminyltransferase, contains WSC domain n=1 Tax=Phaffia rhodozyma TaxID=264483 RepID=A0A0F7SNL6_PHARH|nr:beta-1,6-N-acetylglucosaminyltransferase, contains WSC domain [Phaffia rhodozyma]